MIMPRELEQIKASERKILSMLKPAREFLVDASGNYILDRQGDPILDPVVPTPQKAYVGGENMFGPMEFMDRISEDILNGFEDVYAIDDMFLNPDAYDPNGKLRDYNVRFLGAFDHGIYQGGVWTFNRLGDDQYLGLYGIRSSVPNVIQGRRGVARALLSYIEGLGSFRTIVIPWPLESMIPLLTSSGYIEHNSRTSNPERQFLSPVASTINYWTKNLRA